MFFLLYKHTVDGVFDDFTKISDHFSKISEDSLKFPEGQTNVPEHFPRISENSKDFRRLPKTFDGDPKMFRWYSNEYKYNLRDKRDITEIIDIRSPVDIFTCEAIVSFLSICYHSLYHWLLYNKAALTMWWRNSWSITGQTHKKSDVNLLIRWQA